MLNRRFLRIKVMQALYGYYRHEQADVNLFEKEMFKSLDKIYDLYLTILSLLSNIHHVALVMLEENKNKRLPVKEDLYPNLKFINNGLLTSLVNNKQFEDLCTKKKINWQNDFDLVRKLYNDLKGSDLYKAYMSSNESSFKEDKEFLENFVTEQLNENSVLFSIFEDKNLHWADDTFVAFNSVMRNFEACDKEFNLMPLLKDEKDDLEFMSALFRKTIVYKQEYSELIAKHTQNWEIERIANMDMLLMEMALTEILHIPSVPVKASLNEYIDISKEYSTPQSKSFLNGILDKIISELKTENKINKLGRGLKDN